MDIRMEDVQVLYPDCIREGSTWFDAPGDYNPLLDSMGRILVRWDENDYRGDTVALMERNGQYGVLIFGWGSCSGCDALLGCESYLDVHNLRQELFNRIQWGTADETITWTSDHDWRGSFLTARFPTQRFIAAVEQALRRDPLDREPYIVESEPEPPEPPVVWPEGRHYTRPAPWGTTRRLTSEELFSIDPSLVTLTSVHDIAAYLNNTLGKAFPPPDDGGSEADGTEHAG